MIILKQNPRPELVFGLVGPLGVDLDQVYDVLHQTLEKVRYNSEKITLSDSISEITGLESAEKIARNMIELNRE